MNTPIPEDVMKAARRLAKKAVYHGGVDWATDDIARALMAERDECARIAETAGCYMAESCGDGPASHSIGVWRGKSGPEIASAIRDRSKP